MTVQCPECKRRFKTAQALGSHRRYVHSIEGRKQRIVEKIEELEKKIREIEEGLRRTLKIEELEKKMAEIEKALDGTLTDIRKRFKCSCGAQGWVAVNIKCTKCGREDWWGWWPKSELEFLGI